MLAGIVSALLGNPGRYRGGRPGCPDGLGLWGEYYGSAGTDCGRKSSVSQDEGDLEAESVRTAEARNDAGFRQQQCGRKRLSYEDYLKMLSLLETKETLRVRMLDLIEWNLKMRLNCRFFRRMPALPGCGFKVSVSSEEGLHISFQRIMHINNSNQKVTAERR